MGRTTKHAPAGAPKRKTLGRRLFQGIFALALITAVASLTLSFGITLGWAKMLHGDAKAVVVTSNSMQPEFSARDVIAVRPIDPTALKVGDVITMKRPTGTIVTHRIVGVENGPTGPLFNTQGDANNSEDTDIATGDQVLGVYDGKIPAVGQVLAFVQSLEGRLITVAPAVLILVFMEVVHLWRPRSEEGDQPVSPDGHPLVDASQYLSKARSEEKGRHRSASKAQRGGVTSADRGQATAVAAPLFD